MNILLTAAGGVSPSNVREVLAKHHKVFACDINPTPWVFGASLFEACFQVPTLSDPSHYVHSLLTLAKTHGISMIIPMTDVECDVLSTHKPLFFQHGITIACQDAEVQAMCRNKLLLAKSLEGVCKVIDTYSVAEDVPCGYPRILKPLNGRSSQGLMKAMNEKEYNIFKTLRDDYVVQPFLSGHIFTVDAVRDNVGNTMCYARCELLRTVNGLGTTVELFPNHPLDGIVANIMAKLNIVGCVNMEFIEHKDDYYFLEVNPRFSGGVGFSLKGGYDFATAHLKAILGQSIDLSHQKRHAILKHGYQIDLA